jgi:hypothetical protein
VSQRTRAKKRPAGKKKSVEGFSGLPWVPEELPAVAKNHWPRQTDWPSDADIQSFVRETENVADVRLAVLTGLRRWAEPASSQLMVSLGSFILAVAAIGVGLSSLHPLFYVGILISAALYLVFAFALYGRAVNMDQRRKMAHAWVRAIEDELIAQRSSPRADARRRSRFGAQWRSPMSFARWVRDTRA